MTLSDGFFIAALGLVIVLMGVSYYLLYFGYTDR